MIYVEKINPLMIVDKPLGPAAKAHSRLRNRANKIDENMEHTLIFNYDIHGYGDTIVAAWIAEGCRGSKKRVIFKASNERKKLLEMLGQIVVNQVLPSLSHVGEYVTDIYSIGQPPFVVARALTNGIPHIPLRPEVKYTNEALEFGDKYGTDVVICPQSHSNNRMYPWEKWLNILDILRTKGIQFRVFGPSNGFIEKVPESVCDYQFTNLAGLFHKSRLFVGVDSGPAHLAGTVDIPSIVLLGRTTEEVFSHCVNTTCISTPKKELWCSGCWSGYGYTKNCDITCQAINMITEERIVEAIEYELRRERDDIDPQLRDMITLSNGKFNNGQYIECDRHKSLHYVITKASKSYILPTVIYFGGLQSLTDWSNHGMVPIILTRYCEKNNGRIDFYASNDLTKQRLETAIFHDDIPTCTANIVYVDVNIDPEIIEKCADVNSIIVFDDSASHENSIGYLRSKGWIVTYQSFQTVMEYVYE